MNSSPSNISILIPLYNEEEHIEKCLTSVLRQSYPRDNIEVFLLDGMSTDKTREIVSEYIEKYPDLFRLIDNPDRIVPKAMNKGIELSKGEYIIRLDAHSEYSDDYFEKCISTLREVDADNVGGLAEAKGTGRLGKAYAQVLSSKFGVGNSGFRTGAKSGYTDTVPFGAYKRSTFEKYGMYDERLARNQDYELNSRIRRGGGKIWLNSDIRLKYNCKNSFFPILKQSYENGYWNIVTMKFCPGSMGLRHFIPLIFLLSLIFLPLISIFFSPVWYLLAAEGILYTALNILFSAKIDIEEKTFLFFEKLILFFFFHVSYGAGSLFAVFSSTKGLDIHENSSH